MLSFNIYTIDMRIHFKRIALVAIVFLLIILDALYNLHKANVLTPHCVNITEIKTVYKERTITVTTRVESVKKTPMNFDSIEEVIRSLRNTMFEQFSTQSIRRYYDEELVEEILFNKTLSLTNPNDIALMKTLFPGHAAQSTHSADRILRQLSLRLKSQKLKRILSMHNSDLTNDRLVKDKCNINQCTFTRDPKMIDQVDAVVFNHHPRNLRRPPNKPEQIWIFNQLESPMHSSKIISSNFNWTATYRTDSVITTPYEKFATFPNIDFPLRPQRNYAQGKTKLVAWFVSNCGGSNGRMEYVKELQKYARIDIYGVCGDLNCNRYDKKCFEDLKQHYKFYLAFENSNCRDYITEKLFWNALSNDVVPIVMGAHPDDYKKLAPPNSYIHVDDFHGPRQLAEYIHIVDRNDALYNKYFQWKGTGSFINTKFICRLCAMVQIAPLFPMTYPDLGTWWKNDFTCVRPQSGQRWASWKTFNRSENHNDLVEYRF